MALIDLRVGLLAVNTLHLVQTLLLSLEVLGSELRFAGNHIHTVMFGSGARAD